MSFTYIKLKSQKDFYNDDQTLNIPKDHKSIRFVVLSDTHMSHDNIKEIPDGDFLLHCGDFTNYGTICNI